MQMVHQLIHSETLIKKALGLADNHDIQNDPVRCVQIMALVDACHFLHHMCLVDKFSRQLVGRQLLLNGVRLNPT